MGTTYGKGEIEENEKKENIVIERGRQAARRANEEIAHLRKLDPVLEEGIP